ncbi:Protein SMG5 [Eumeta japonica]|uniref:Protein SMG5 n=1 Tax=Eumeta variegata TaxID=151549 RepID=A0A4C1YZM0_EUMVA|nr:Protein SMG5 [Eumeta japonica]
MKSARSENSEVDVVEINERIKKLYRYVSDIARRIDEAVAGCCSVADLFSINIELLRHKLRDNCEKLMLLDPINYGKKCLELLWRKVYYETVSAAKKLNKADEDYDNYLFTHILCGIGHLHHLIARIQHDMKLQIKEIDYIQLHNDEEIENMSDSAINNEFLVWGRSILHSCLIYLGDLSRYQVEIFHTVDSSIAARYYLQASHLDLSSGMPYNQLGNLYLDKNHNLDSVCYYIHCLNFPLPFEGAMGNLTKLFDKNTKHLESTVPSPNWSQSEHIQDLVSRFLSLIEIWYLGKENSDVSTICNVVVHLLKTTLGFKKTEVLDDMLSNATYTELMQTLEEEHINPSYMNANIIHKMVLISLFTISKVSETEEKGAFAAKAFTFALLSQLLQKLLQQLHTFGLKNPASCYKHYVSTSTIEDISEKVEENEKSATIDTNGIEDQPKITPNGDTQNGNISDKEEKNKKESNNDTQINNKKSLLKRRRRRRVAFSDSSDLSDSEIESTSIESSLHDSDSSLEFEDDSKTDISENEDDPESTSNNGLVLGSSKEIIEEGHEIKEIIVQKEETNKTKAVKEFVSEDLKVPNTGLDAVRIQNFLKGDNFLPSLKLLQDWMLTEKELILSCGESGDSLFQCIVDLINILEYHFKTKRQDTVEFIEILNYSKSVSKKLESEYKRIPLPEDVNLRGTSICKFDKDSAEWQLLNNYKPTNYEENIIRILSFIDFGHQIAKIVPRIRYNRSLQIFYLKKVSTPKLNTKINHKRIREWHNSKKSLNEGAEGGLLRRLGQLWLASKVRELERYGNAEPAPALLALDAAALHSHLRCVKQLLRARTYLILVPTVVLQELDELKRELSGARDAIRWLEAQLQTGSRFLRAQRPGQARPLPLLKYPRKAPAHIHNFIQILEFCYHFIAEEKQPQGGGDQDGAAQSKSAPLLLLLTGNEPGAIDDQYKEFSVKGAAQAAGISLQHIGDFYTQWRNTVHKGGKKR